MQELRQEAAAAAEVAAAAAREETAAAVAAALGEAAVAAAAAAVAAAAAQAELRRWQQLARGSDEWAAADDPDHVLTTFARSNFKPQYDQVARRRPLLPQQKDRVLFCVRHIVEDYCDMLYTGDLAATTLQVAAGRRFLLDLHGEWQLNDDADTAAERVWSSGKLLIEVGAGGVHAGGGGPQREFCFIFSQAIRGDRASIARACAILARGLKTNLVHPNGAREGVYPEVLDAVTGNRVSAGECWRGGGFNMAHQGFFTAGKKYRVPGFLATSPRRDATNPFKERAEAAGFRVVQWKFEFDPRGDPLGAGDQARRCKHINKLRVTHFRGEDEYLFQAFSPFTVTAADFTTAGTAADPFLGTLEPALDGLLEDEGLPHGARW